MKNQPTSFNEDFKYAGSFRRSLASAIDFFLANIIRIIVATILGRLWFNNKIITFQNQFKEKFGTNIIGRDAAQVEFFANHPIFNQTIIFFLIVFLSGAIYYVALNNSIWRATIGKKIMKIIIVKSDGGKLNILESICHYLLSLVPWLFVVYILIYQLMHGVNIYNAIVGDLFNLIFGLITLAWLQIHLITKKKTTAHDLICHTVMITPR
jgi:uncharacterized RDD family membrane protein YckC